MSLSHKPQVLYLASFERSGEALRAFEHKDYVLAAYLCGVSVECVLQAIALRSGEPHDARHDLGAWLAKCPPTLQAAIQEDCGAEWSFLVASWDNAIRYFSFEGFTGHLRSNGLNRGIKGGPPSFVRKLTKRMTESASKIHAKGVAQWQRR